MNSVMKTSHDYEGCVQTIWLVKLQKWAKTKQVQVNIVNKKKKELHNKLRTVNVGFTTDGFNGLVSP